MRDLIYGLITMVLLIGLPVVVGTFRARLARKLPDRKFDSVGKEKGELNRPA